MIPSSPRHGLAIFQHPKALRRSVALVAAIAALGGTPFVAHAIGGAPADAVDVELVADTPTDWPTERRSEPMIPDLGSDLARSEPDAVDESTVSVPVVPAPEPAPLSPIEVAIGVLTDVYAWDERGPRVEALQSTLGVAVDGWYGHSTLSAHRSALESAGFPTDGLPVAPVPAGPSGEQWAALRQCESGGDYAITNPSGKYRGAYQFDRSTWNSVAERHAPRLVGADPAAASPADQDAMALALYGERGPRPWPNCGRHLR